MALRKIDKIIVHCADTPDGKDFTIKDIDRWHKERGWQCCGYHHVIRLDGTIENGRPLAQIGAHCKGYNENSIGICLIGRREFTPGSAGLAEKPYRLLSETLPRFRSIRTL